MTRLRVVLLRVAVNLYGYLVLAAGIAVLFVALAPIMLTFGRFVPAMRRGYALVIHRFIRLYFAAFPYLRIEVTGRENLPEGGGYILVGNHLSWLDPVIVISLLSRVCGAAKPYLFRVPLLATMAGLAGFFPIDPDSRRDLDRTRRLCRNAEREGSRILFFPEGTRSRDGRVGPFTRGAFRMAAEHGLRLQPFLIRGSNEFIRPGHAFSRAARPIVVRVHFLPGRPAPEPGSLGRADIRRMAEEERARIAEAIEAFDAGRESEASGEPL